MIADCASNTARIPAMHQQNRHRWWLWVVPFLLLVAWLTMLNINRDAVWIDEVITFERVGAPPYGPSSIPEVIDSATLGSWPPFYYIVYWTWGRVAGWSIFAGRYLSLLFGMVAVSLVYRLGHDLDGAGTGLFAAIVLSTTALFTYYLHEIRGYSLQVLLTVAMVWSYRRMMHPTKRATRSLQITFGGAVVLLLYTHAVSVLLVCTLTLYHLVSRSRQTRQWNLVLYFIGIAGLLFVPWLVLPLISTAIYESSDPRGMPAWKVLDTGLYAFGNGWPLLLIAFGVYAAFRVRGQAAGLIAALLGGTLGLALAVNVVVDYLFHIRHLLAFTPLIALLLALCLTDLRNMNPALPLILLCLWIVPGVYHSRNNGFVTSLPGGSRVLPQPGFSATLDQLEALASPNDVVFFQVGLPQREVYTQVVLDYYLHASSLQFAQFDTVSVFEEKGNNIGYDEKISTFVAGALRIWLVTIPNDYSQAPVQKTIAEIETLGYRYCGHAWETQDFHIDVYSQQACDDIALVP